jgi:hypothetical protein
VLEFSGGAAASSSSIASSSNGSLVETAVGEFSDPLDFSGNVGFLSVFWRFHKCCSNVPFLICPYTNVTQVEIELGSVVAVLLSHLLMGIRCSFLHITLQRTLI